mgnify:CR=1 FL=1
MIPSSKNKDFQNSDSCTVDTNVSIRMRDGTELYADIYRPKQDAQCPVLLMRLPYGKHVPAYRSMYLDPIRAVGRGYAVVVQDVRGRHRSEGQFYPYINEAQDGYDTVEWCGSQPWSDGNVGMFGISYHGATQWLAASEAPPSLKAIVPGVTSDDYYDSWTYLGGAFQLWWISQWMLGFAENDIGKGYTERPKKLEELDQMQNWLSDPLKMAKHLPLQDMTAFKGKSKENDLCGYYYDWLSHSTYDDYWKSFAPKEKFHNVNIPVLNIAGWHDIFIRGSINCYQGMREKGGTELSRTQQHLIVGPWLHAPLPSPNAGQQFYGRSASGASIDLHGMQLDWFDRWLKGDENGIDSQPTAYVFVMGKNEWQAEQTWPPSDVDPINYYLTSNGAANSVRGNGKLSSNPPGNNEPTDHFKYDPMNPVPSLGGAYLYGIPGVFEVGVQDQQLVEDREDVLVYSSGVLENDLEIAGRVKLNLWAKTSAYDTDWTAKLLDVDEYGKSTNVCDGILRARFNKSLEKECFVNSNQVECFTIDLGFTAMLFTKGHRIRVQISSSNFPAFDRNLNTGKGFGDSQIIVAEQTIFHDSKYPSFINLPKINR